MRDNKTALMEKTAEILAAKGLTLTEAEIAALFEKPSDPKLGDLALPCFKLAKTLRQAPPKIAAELAECYGGTEGLARAEAVGGYLNFFYDSASSVKVVEEILADARYGSEGIWPPSHGLAILVADRLSQVQGSSCPRGLCRPPT